MPLKYRIANVMVALVTYMRRMIWPNDLAYFYPLQHPLPHWKVWIAGLVLTAITLLVYFRRQRPALVFGCFFFVITILPVIGIVQLGRQSMADRYAYIPLIGLFIAITWEAADIAGRRNIPPFAQACVAVLILGLFANCTRITESYWRNDLALFQRAHDAVRPANIEIETNLGAALNDVGRYAEALTYFRNAESIDPKSFTAHYNCGYDLAQLRDDAAAAVEFQEALRYAPLPELKVRALNSLGIAYLNQGQGQQAASTFSELLAIEPQNARAAALRTEALEMAGKSGQAAKR